MQKIRKTVHQPLSLTRLVVGSGIALFLAGIFVLWESSTVAGIGAARASFVWAGWVLTAGWVLKRVEDRQWPFSSRLDGARAVSGRLLFPMTCVFALVLGVSLWRTYGPLMQGVMPVNLVSATPNDAPVPFREQNLLPVPNAFLSLTAAAQPWTFDRLAAARGRYRSHGPGFSSQAMVSPPALSGKLPSSWDIQP